MKRQIVKFVPGIITPIMSKGYILLSDAIDWAKNRDRMLPPKSMRGAVGGDFLETGQEFRNYFIDMAGLQPNARVLDVGCGIGRMAIPLTSYLSKSGEYWGFDIVKKWVGWCQGRISPKFTNFNFVHSDIKSKLYNENGKEFAACYKFPFKDNYFDFVFLTSVFTHMFPADLENYLSEISRVVKTDGKCFITFFLLNEESEKLIKSGESSLNFKHSIEGCLIVDTNIPEDAIAHNEKKITDLLIKYGLSIDQKPYYGSWCGRANYLSFQDIIIATKAPGHY